jgi:hypothetical protein
MNLEEYLASGFLFPFKHLQLAYLPQHVNHCHCLVLARSLLHLTICANSERMRSASIPSVAGTFHVEIETCTAPGLFAANQLFFLDGVSDRKISCMIALCRTVPLDLILDAFSRA